MEDFGAERWSGTIVRPRVRATTARQSYVALGVGLLFLVVFVALIDRAVAPVVFLAGAAFGTLLSTIGAVRMPPSRRRIWVAMAVGQALFLVGEALWALFDNVLHVAPYPSLADAAFLSGYPALALGMLWLVRGRRRGRDRAAFLDAAILTTGVAVCGVVFLVAPVAETGGATLLSQVVAAAYPIGDLLVLAVALRMATAGMAHNQALWALLGSVATLLVADLFYVASVLADVAYPAWIDIGYLLSFVLLGFAALHPSAHVLSEPMPDRPDRITAARVAWLGVALILTPLTDQVARVTGADQGLWVIPVGGVVTTVLVVLRLWGLVHDLQDKAVQLAALARKDGLTGVPNRRTWDHELSRACALARDHGTPLSVAVLDMDHFKEFNDLHGHVAGDLVLKETAAAWAAVLEGRGFLARYGGEEFTALLPRLTSTGSQVLLERMRRAVTHDQTCSIGIATWDGVESPAALVSRADQALYQAKRSGRDRIAVHNGGTATVVTASPQSPALASMRMAFQPIVDLRTGEVVGREALSRFDGQDPRAVFDAAVKDGTAPALEAAAITRALAAWDRVGLLSLNTSLTALATPTVRTALGEDLTGVVIEITESDLVDYTPEVLLAVQDARRRGALVAIDDYGAGFSNAHRIAMIRPDIIKIDMTLVRGIDEEPMLQAVVTSCVLLAELTGARVIAEGIETPEERDCIAGLGIDLGQGYLLGRPAEIPAEIRAEVQDEDRAEVQDEIPAGRAGAAAP